MSKRDKQFLRAAGAKEPGYDKFVKALKEAKRIAKDKHIVSRNVHLAIRKVFGEEEPGAAEEPITKTLQSSKKPGEHETALRQSGRDPRGTHSKLSPPQ